MRKTTTAEDLARIELVGRMRLDNEEVVDSALFIPTPATWTKKRKALIMQQMSSMGGQEVVMNHYAELLVRTAALLDFMHHNVGTTEDWPLMLRGESEHAEMHFGDLLGQVEAAVGCLTEI